MQERRLPAEWNSWQLQEVIGEGSFGTVYRAVKTSGEEKFFSAIKIIDIPSDVSETEQLMREMSKPGAVRLYYRDVVNNYLREIRLMESLKGITNIVSIEDYCVQERTDMIGWTIFIRMEYLISFTDYSAEHKLTEEQIVSLGADICTALEYCTKAGIIHRDIKPDNIFISAHGDFKLGDFGVARECGKTIGSFSAKGTYTYMAPEVYKGEPYNASADIYSLGLVLYRLMNNNREPFVDATKQIVYYKDRDSALAKRMSGEKLPPPVNASAQLSAVILKAAAYNAKDRYQTPAEFREALQTLGRTREKKEKQLSAFTKAVIGCVGAAAVIALIVSSYALLKIPSERRLREEAAAVQTAQMQVQPEKPDYEGKARIAIGNGQTMTIDMMKVQKLMNSPAFLQLIGEMPDEPSVPEGMSAAQALSQRTRSKLVKMWNDSFKMYRIWEQLQESNIDPEVIEGILECVE